MYLNLLISLVIAYLGQATFVLAQEIQTETITSNTLTRLNYEVVEQGTVSIFLPAQILPGDTVSSRIRTKTLPDGKLDTYRIRMANKSHPVQDGLVEWTVPNDASAEVNFELVDASGDVSARVALSLANHPTKSKGSPGRDGTGIKALPMRPRSGSYTPIADDFFEGIEIMAASPRELIIFDSLVLDIRPDPVLCCSEGGPCGLTSCCDFIPSSSCLHCNVSGYDVCLADAGPPTPNPNPD
ncbi:MAG: hypothetical protein AAFX90_05870 [Pseudomonadota bacterium]